MLACAHIFPPALPPPPVAKLLARWCDQMLDAEGEAWPLVVELEEDVIAAVLAKATSDQKNTGEIWGLYVDPDHWGAGFGPRLLEAATERLRSAGLAEAVLWVLDANTRARKLYEDAGWSPDGATRAPLPGAPDILELRYRRSLAPDENPTP